MTDTTHVPIVLCYIRWPKRSPELFSPCHTDPTKSLSHDNPTVCSTFDVSFLNVDLFDFTDTTELAIDTYRRLGLRPILSWLAKPNLVKTMTEGRTVGYDNTYKCGEGEVLATLSIGYGDGYNRQLSGRGIVTTDKGSECPVVGRVSMDAISVRLPSNEEKCSTLYIVKDDLTSPNSVVELAKQLKTITYDVTTGLAARLSRVYVMGGMAYLNKS